ncbi:hypothetical protein B9Z19DRAFT_1076844 [Tuber borchii]|uniref:Uncharacterized protein n=1 Tax=Tuber borchii TaxID=42251 RepID=A0A2T7A1G2_TUBBO|nr:hypothetical protein B9Z19DRAFT_1076844 [Tuber borchii]
MQRIFSVRRRLVRHHHRGTVWQYPQAPPRHRLHALGKFYTRKSLIQGLNYCPCCYCCCGPGFEEGGEGNQHSRLLPLPFLSSLPGLLRRGGGTHLSWSFGTIGTKCFVFLRCFLRVLGSRNRFSHFLHSVARFVSSAEGIRKSMLQTRVYQD